jgi:hypothetical protein
VPWNVTTADGVSGHFYIDTTADAYNPAGFTRNSTTPTGADTIGFLIYGSNVMFQSSVNLLSQFWAQNTTAGVWTLKWNVDGANEDTSVPVLLKITAPVAVSAV